MLGQKILNLKQKLLVSSEIVGKMLEKSVRALTDKNLNLAKEVIEQEEPAENKNEIEIDNEAVQLIALYQPEAVDLRNIIMIIKVNNDLERIADHAVNIAQRGIYQLIPYEDIESFNSIQQLAVKCIGIFKECLEAFIKQDAEKAIRICREDSAINILRNQIIRELISRMLADSNTIERAIALMMVTKDLERIADLVTNIAEDIVFVVSGKDIRHHNLFAGVKNN